MLRLLFYDSLILCQPLLFFCLTCKVLSHNCIHVLASLKFLCPLSVSGGDSYRGRHFFACKKACALSHVSPAKRLRQAPQLQPRCVIVWIVGAYCAAALFSAVFPHVSGTSCMFNIMQKIELLNWKTYGSGLRSTKRFPAVSSTDAIESTVLDLPDVDVNGTHMQFRSLWKI